MTIHEFDIIQNFFANQTTSRSDVILGIGDDAAITTIPQNHELVITMDTLISGVHFPENTSAFDIGYKSLAVNLSDLAAMGATPAWASLALTLPKADEKWLAEFTEGFFTLANQYNVQLIGGDLTQGALSITIQIHGFVPTGSALRRDTAKPGDRIYVTNTLGNAGLALYLLKNSHVPENLLQKLNRPQPQIEIGQKLRGIANAMIDISDGLAADLKHILEKSHVGADVNLDLLPLSDTLRVHTTKKYAVQLAITAGDDYELCFTVPENKIHLLEQALKGYSYTYIGKINQTCELNLYFNNGEKYGLKISGYQHF